MDKEPLFYLFILNTDFIHNEDIQSDYAAVSYTKGRVKFYYTEKFLNLPVKKLYFVLVHEAYHIFKRHLTIHMDLYKKNPKIANIAEDSIINTEIADSSFNGIKPDWDGLHPHFMPGEYKEKYRHLGKDAYVTPRLFNWMNREKKLTKKEILLANKKCKNTKTGKYGKIVQEEGEDTFYVLEYEDGLEGLIEDGKLKDNGTIDHIDDLIPVFVGGNKNSHEQGNYDGDYEAYGFTDSHQELNESHNKPEPISKDVFAQKILKQAKEMVDKSPTSKKRVGTGTGNTILEKFEQLLKPSVSWKKIFNKNLNLYYSNSSISKTKKKSILTYLMNAKSRNGFIFRHWIKVKNRLQRYIFVAVDTSGSCFYDEHDMKTFFTEIDSIAEQLEFSNSGKVFVLQWGHSIERDWVQYHKGDWKRFQVVGGGGTSPLVIFRHIDRNMIPVGDNSLMCQLEKGNSESNLFIPDKNKMPFLIVLTDGMFGKLEKKDLGLYEKNTDNILFVTKETFSLYDGAKHVLIK